MSEYRFYTLEQKKKKKSAFFYWSHFKYWSFLECFCCRTINAMLVIALIASVWLRLGLQVHKILFMTRIKQNDLGDMKATIEKTEWITLLESDLMQGYPKSCCRCKTKFFFCCDHMQNGCCRPYKIHTASHQLRQIYTYTIVHRFSTQCEQTSMSYGVHKLIDATQFILLWFLVYMCMFTSKITQNSLTDF